MSARALLIRLKDREKRSFAFGFRLKPVTSNVSSPQFRRCLAGPVGGLEVTGLRHRFANESGDLAAGFLTGGGACGMLGDLGPGLQHPLHHAPCQPDAKFHIVGEAGP